LEWRSGRRRRPGIGEREDAEARAPAPPDGPDVTAHGYAAVVRRRDEVGVAAAEIRLASAEEAEDGAGAARAVDLAAAQRRGEGVAGVLFRPHDGGATGRRPAAPPGDPRGQ